VLKSLFMKSDVAGPDTYYQAVKAFQRNPNMDFASVKRYHGMAVAYHYAQLYFTSQKSYGRFRREIDLHSDRGYNQLNNLFDVLVVPPPASLIKPYISQRLTKQAVSLAIGAGFGQSSQLQLESANALEGARRLLRVLQERHDKARPLLLVSYSFGSTFVRILLDQASSEDLRWVKGWVNVSGLVYGSPRYHCSDRFFLSNPMTRDLRSFSCEQKYLQKSFDTHGIKTLHFLGLKSPSLMNFTEWRNCNYLRAWGPNDGLVPLSHYQKVSGPVVPIMNQTHLIDFGEMASLYVRSLSSMVSTLPMQSHPLQGSEDLGFTRRANP
jgi:hypothetical protein